MTIKNLIEILQIYPPDQTVLVDGYEDGFDDIAKIETRRLKIAAPHNGYLGDYEDVSEFDIDIESREYLILSRSNL